MLGHRSYIYFVFNCLQNVIAWILCFPVMEELKTLFDPHLIEHASPSESMEHYEKRLGYICKEMLKYDLVIGKRRYDMLEIEAYLTAPNHGHPDPYCHGHPLQKKSGAWVKWKKK